MKTSAGRARTCPTAAKWTCRARRTCWPSFTAAPGWRPNVRHATYVIHYADGGKVEIPVIGGKNILDWALPGSRADEVAYDPALGLLLPAVSVPSPQFVHVTVWMLLWKNPRPGKEIAALEVKGPTKAFPA